MTVRPQFSASRRDILKGATALTFLIGASGVASIAYGADDAPLGVNPWVSIATDGTITIVFPATEMGQGSSTALPVILAEELDANWDDVVVEQLDRDDRTYGNPLFGNVLYTAGSTAVSGYFEPLRRAGAQARAVLLQIAARHLSVDAAELRTVPSAVVAPDGTRLSYGELAAMGAQGITVPAPEAVALKSPSDFRLIGASVPRRDVEAKSTGRETYAIDVTLPQMTPSMSRSRRWRTRRCFARLSRAKPP